VKAQVNNSNRTVITLLSKKTMPLDFILIWCMTS
jgi:hypothetical protein